MKRNCAIYIRVDCFKVIPNAIKKLRNSVDNESLAYVKLKYKYFIQIHSMKIWMFIFVHICCSKTVQYLSFAKNRIHHHSSFLKNCNTIVREGFLKKNDVIPGTRCNLFEKWFSDPDLFYFRLDKEKVLDRKRNWSFQFLPLFYVRDWSKQNTV